MIRCLLFSLICICSLFVSGQDLIPFQDSRGKFGLKNENEKVIVTPRYDKIKSFVEGLAAVNIGGAEDEDDADLFLGGLWGFINEEGKEVIGVKYTDAREFAEGLVPVELNEKWGFIDKTGKTVIPFSFNGAYLFGDGLAAVCNEQQKWGAVNKKGTLVVPYLYSTLFIFYSGKAHVAVGMDQFYIDKTGKRLK